FTFYRLLPEWRRLPAEARAEQKRELLRVLDEADERTIIRAYTTVGLRGDVDFLLWKVSDRLEGLRELATAVATTAIGRYPARPPDLPAGAPALAVRRRPPPRRSGRAPDAGTAVRRPLPLRLPVREDARLVPAAARRAAADHGRAHTGRPPVPIGQDQHDLL